MAFTVEDGTGLATANAYISVADADAFHADRGNADWAAVASSALKEQAIVRATEFLVQKYRLRWKGMRVKLAQALDWPRAGVMTEDYYEPDSEARPIFAPTLAFLIPSDTVPKEVKEATADLALRALAAALAPDLERGGQVQSQTVGPISTTWFRGAPGGTSYVTVERNLGPLLRASNRHRVVRS